MPSIVFAKKDGKGGGGGSGNSGTGNGKDKESGGDKNGKDDRKGGDDEQDKKDKNGKGDKEDKKDKKDKKEGEKDKDAEKDKEGKKGKKDKKEGEKDKDAEKDKEGKKDKKDKKEGKKDKNDKKDKKDKKKEDGEDGSESGDRDEQESRDDDHDHDRNERHDHDNETADGRHDHETEERRHKHRDDEDSSEKNEEKDSEQDDEQGAEHEHEAGQNTTSAEAGEDANAESKEASAADKANAESNTAPGVVTLSWTPPVENEDGSPLMDLAGYRVFWRKTSWDHTESLQIDNPGLSRVVIEDLDAGTYEFAMTSLNSEGIESTLSNSVTRIVEGPVSTADGEADAAISEKSTAPSAESTAEPSPHLMISGTPPEAVTAGELYLFTPAIESSGDTPPAFTIDGLPHWAGFDEVSGELYGTPDLADLGLYGTITISATDGVVETSLPPFSIEVVAPGAAMGAVMLSWTPPAENEDGTYLVDLAGYWIYWGNNPGTYTEWLRIDNPGLTMVVIEDLVPGAWEFAMTSFNKNGVESKLSNTVTRYVE